jgi:hypothetical protein
LTTSTTIEEGYYTLSLYFDRKIEAATAGLPREYSKLLYRISNDNAVKIVDYILSLKTEINLSDNYRKDLIKLLSKFSMFVAALLLLLLLLVLITNYYYHYHHLTN